MNIDSDKNKETLIRTYAQVAVPLTKTTVYTYKVPPHFSIDKRGIRVIVPFGRKPVIGYFWGYIDKFPENIELKSISEVIDMEPILPETVIKLAEAISEIYCASIGMVLKSSYPSSLDPVDEWIYSLKSFPKMKSRSSTKIKILELLKESSLPLSGLKYRLPGKKLLGVLSSLEKDGFICCERFFRPKGVNMSDKFIVQIKDCHEALEKPFKAIMEEIKKYCNSPAKITEIAKNSKTTQKKVVEGLRLGLYKIYEPEDKHLIVTKDGPELTKDQERSVEQILPSLGKNLLKIFLLFGVTGSGKTEVYFKAMDDVLKQGKGVLYLVPEISLTSYLAKRLLDRFGNCVAIVHSALGERERGIVWDDIKMGRYKVVIGPRSALFAPLLNTGLIIVDEEHDTSYKQMEYPYYNARDMAIMRGKIENAVVILGSATPSVESYYNATQGKKYTLLTLPKRVNEEKMPDIHVIDMKEEYRLGEQKTIISEVLIDQMKDDLSRGKQVVLLRNRRGFSTFVLCRECGKTITCQNCNVSLSFHKIKGILLCHYCNERMIPPSRCPYCSGEVLQYLGEGTEQVEECIANLFPGKKIVRADSDSIHSGSGFDRLWESIEKGRVDIIVGTQMIAKGHHFANISLVGVIHADFILGMPDFRASERTFQLITQVSGRASGNGNVIVQSFHPDHYVIKSAKEHNYSAFYEEDIRFRKMLAYPPFANLALLKFESRKSDAGWAFSSEIAAKACEFGEKMVRVLGPVESPIPRIKGRFRHQILLKADSRKRLQDVSKKILLFTDNYRHPGAHLFIDIDPINML